MWRVYFRGKNPVAKTIPAECIGVILPFFHTFGVSGIFDNLMGGLKFVIIPNFTLDRFLQAVQDHKVVFWFLLSEFTLNLSVHLFFSIFIDHNRFFSASCCCANG